MTIQNRSWIESANETGNDFPLANLPLGVIDGVGEEPARIAVPIGDQVLDLRRATEQGILPGLRPEDACGLHSETLNQFAGRGREAARRPAEPRAQRSPARS